MAKIPASEVRWLRHHDGRNRHAVHQIPASQTHPACYEPLCYGAPADPEEYWHDEPNRPACKKCIAKTEES